MFFVTKICYNVTYNKLLENNMDKNFDIYFNEESFTDINPLFVGGQICEPCHSFGPRICPYTIIHYVIKGKGTLEQNNETYNVCAGQMFVIYADDIAKYTADKDEPWEYVWIAYDGLYMKKLKDTGKNIFTPSKQIFQELLEKCINEQCNKYYVTSLIYRFHSLFFTRTADINTHDYPAEVKKIIKLKYMQSITVEQIAATLNIDKRYMSRIFKKKYGKTVIDYLIDIRINRACMLLREGYSVADTAVIVGYNDSFNFSKMFKKRIGHSPKDYKTIPY